MKYNIAICHDSMFDRWEQAYDDHDTVLALLPLPRPLQLADNSIVWIYKVTYIGEPG